MKTLKFITIILWFPVILMGQFNLTANNIARLFSNYADLSGWEAIGANPANLALDTTVNSINIGFIPFFSVPGMNLGNNSISMKLLYDDFFTGEKLLEKQKNNLINAINNEGLAGYFQINQNIIKYKTGHWGFGLGLTAFGQAKLPKSLVELGLYGNEFEQPVRIDDLDMEILTFGNINFNYGNEFRHEKVNQYVEHFYWGIGLDFLVGGFYHNLEKMTGYIMTRQDGFDLKSDVVTRFGSGGLGFALDFGMTAQINEKLSASLSLLNAVSYINWGMFWNNFYHNENAGKVKYSYDLKINSPEFFSDELDSLLKNAETEDAVYALENFYTGIPAGYNLSGTYRINEKIKFSGAVYGFLTNEYGLDFIPKVAVSGTYYPVKWWPLIIGLGTTKGNHPAWSFGTGLKFNRYHLDVGLSQYGGMFNNSKGFYFTMDQSFYF